MSRPVLLAAALCLLPVPPATAAPLPRPPAAPAHPAHPAPPPIDPATLPDAAFCGVDPLPLPVPEAREPISCKLPGLPCGPVPASRIGRSGSEPGEDLDGDGKPDITLAGRRDGPRAAAYAVIYRAVEGGYVLSDYSPVDVRADPAVATVTHALPGGPPLLRDGHDLPLSEGRTHSVARLRRWDGSRFRTLISFCAHRTAPLPGGGTREGHNRVEFPDVDRDGTPEVVIGGLVRPVVFRLSEGGLALHEDAALTDRYRQNSPEEQKARTLRAEATKLYAQGQWRRAASVLERAHDIARYNVDVTLQLATTLLRLDEARRAVQLLKDAQALQPELAALYCAMGEALRKLDDDDGEEKALQECLSRGPEPAARRAAEARLQEIAAERAAEAPAAPAPGSPSASPSSPSASPPSP